MTNEQSFDDLMAILAVEDRHPFLLAVDRIPDKTQQQAWTKLAQGFGAKRRYEAEQLSRTHAKLCDYFGEPRNANNLFMRAQYESSVSPDVVRACPFMNLGYHHLNEDVEKGSIELDEKDRRHLCNANLYTHFVDRDMVQGKDLVEVGSGRGGGASFIVRHYAPRSYIGVDGSRKLVSVCNEVYAGSPRFVWGNATSLPLETESADVVLNVESAHNYNSLDKFVSEVHRILRKGGRFLLTDLLITRSVSDYLSSVQRHFHVERSVNVTANVLECMRAHGANQLVGQIDAHLKFASSPLTSDAVCTMAWIYLPIVVVPYSVYGSLTSGRSYISFTCVKK
jgi:ubiquinone/menaquinone biosynthesis C-methylase UbiE